MNCQETQEQISQFIDNALSPELLQPMFQHLSDCEKCRSFFMNSNIVHEAAKKIDAVAVPDALDRKFAPLTMNNVNNYTGKRMITFSIPSAILSGVLIFMMSLLLFLTITPKDQPMNGSSADEQAMMMIQSSPADQFHRQ